MKKIILILLSVLSITAYCQNNRNNKLKKKKHELVTNLPKFIDFQTKIDSILNLGETEFYGLESYSFSKVQNNKIKLEFANINNRNDLAFRIIQSTDENNGRCIVTNNVINPADPNGKQTYKITFFQDDLDKIDPIVNFDMVGNDSNSVVAGKFRFSYVRNMDGEFRTCTFIPDDLVNYNIVQKTIFIPKN